MSRVRQAALVIGLIADAITILTLGRSGAVAGPSFRIELTPVRIWMLAIFGAIASPYFVSRRMRRDLFAPTSDGRIPVEAFLVMAPWLIVAGSITDTFWGHRA